MDDTIAVTVAGSLMNAEAEMEAAGFSSKNSLLHRIMLIFQIRSTSVGYRACRTLSPQAAQQGNIRHATPRVNVTRANYLLPSNSTIVSCYSGIRPSALEQPIVLCVVYIQVFKHSLHQGVVAKWLLRLTRIVQLSCASNQFPSGA